MSNIWITQLRNPKTDEPKNAFIWQKILTRLKNISTKTILDQIQNTTSGKLNFIGSLKDAYQNLKIDEL